jgi:methyltransferase (TIGR00027 family)
MATRPIQASNQEPLMRNISDTALWAAVFRGWESKRPDALFRDPYAERLAGQRGARIAQELKFGTRHTWSWIARTYAFDQMIGDEIARGADMVINLAAGLDTRPYRMALPPSLTWVEIDLPAILEYKQEFLRGERPACPLEQIKLDLANVSARRGVFAELGRRAKRALILSEGLIIYLSREEVAALAADLAEPPSFRSWILDLTSPALLRMLKKGMGAHLEKAGAPLKFGPEEGPDFFLAYGWKPARAQSLAHVAARLKRLPLWMRPFAWFPDRFPKQGKRPWGGACLLVREEVRNKNEIAGQE